MLLDGRYLFRFILISKFKFVFIFKLITKTKTSVILTSVITTGTHCCTIVH